MKLTALQICTILLCLTVFAVVSRLLRGEQIPDFLVGFAGALCGILFHLFREKRRDSQQ